MVGGGDGKCDCARRAASIFLGQMGVVDKLPAAVYQNTNAVPARDSREAVSMALDIAKFLKKENKKTAEIPRFFIMLNQDVP